MFTRELTKSLKIAENGIKSRILVVEDEDLIREMLILALSAEGYATTIALLSLRQEEILKLALGLDLC